MLHRKLSNIILRYEISRKLPSTGRLDVDTKVLSNKEVKAAIGRSPWEMTRIEYFKAYSPIQGAAYLLGDQILTKGPFDGHVQVFMSLDPSTQDRLIEGLENGSAQDGFVTRDGDFVTRDQASALLDKSPNLQSEDNRAMIDNQYKEELLYALENRKPIPQRVRDQREPYITEIFENEE
jgi:hypothetical protein